MHQTGKFKYAEDPEWQMLEMPYAGEDVVMTVLLPQKLDGLAALERSLTADSLAAWLARLAKREVDVTLPKFKVTSASRLDEPLKALGMTAAFGAADFSGMTGKRDFTIGAVLHKAFVDVNEEGTEAAGATAVIMMRTSAIPEKRTVFLADHPFVFLIRHAKTDSILFIGRVMNPKT
jgi:serpin B